MCRRLPYLLPVVIAFTLLCAIEPVCMGDDTKLSTQQVEFFETIIRPLLVSKCYSCHSGKKTKGGLRLDSRTALLTGGESGPAIVSGRPEKSLLIEAINYESLEMPPKGKLKEREISLLTRWVKMGAPWPNDKGMRPAAESGKFEVTDEDRNFWAFRSVEKPPLPPVKNIEWVKNPIDTFIFAKLEAKGFQPNPSAGKRKLIRRLYFDLIGLPPTPKEVQSFLDDPSPQAYERIVDDLLSRKQYGERWGRHWLDVVRFGQTNGYERDGEKQNAWRYRDYVIQAFNEDKPYDRFILEQLAGDELDDITHDSIIATGFYRLGVWDDEPDDKMQARYDELDDVIRTTGSAFLGLTLSCVRCHDHKFDPFPHEDYYRLLAFFHNSMPYGRDAKNSPTTHWDPNPDGIFTPLVTAGQLKQWQKKQAEIRKQIEEAETKRKSLGTEAQEEKKKLSEQIEQLKASLQNDPFEKALSIREAGPEPIATRVFIRGNAASPGPQVEPLFPVVFGGLKPKPIRPGKVNDLRKMLLELGVQPTSGRRRALGEWIASRENPLTARVMANRLWQYHFGRGIVRSPNNFGRLGLAPTHPELLDWLSHNFIAGGWTIKRMHKLIVMSSTYQMSSHVGNRKAAAVDPGNDLFWRQNMQRLDAEGIRDSILAVSGKLNLKMGGRGIFPVLSKDVLATQSRPGSGWDHSDEAERSRRSVYIYVKRTLMVPMLEIFDYANTAESLGVRPVTTVAPQSLLLLNSAFMQKQANAFANRVLKEAGDDPAACVDHAFQLALQRSPTEKEKSIALGLLDRQTQTASERSQSAAETDKSKVVQQSALRSLCLVILNLNEFVYID